MLVSIALYFVGVGLVGFIWQLLLSDHGLRPTWWRLQLILFVAQFAKYLPGNVAHHLGRIYLAKQAGIPLHATIHSMALEALYSVGVGSALALLAIFFVLDTNMSSESFGVEPISLGLMGCVTLVLPWLAVRALNRFSPRVASKIFGGGDLVEPRFRTALVVAGLFLGCFFIFGLVLQLQATWLFALPDVSLVELTALFAVAWVAGYLVPGASAGLGVREALMLVLLDPLVGPAVAVGLSVSLRIATTVGDALVFVLGLSLRKLSWK